MTQYSSAFDEWVEGLEWSSPEQSEPPSGDSKSATDNVTEEQLRLF